MIWQRSPYSGSGSIAALAAPLFTALATSVVGTPAAFQTSGYYAYGDGGAATYKMVVSQPTHPGKVQIHGVWYEMVDERCNPAQFGGVGYRYGSFSQWNPVGKIASDTAVANCVAYATQTSAIMDFTQIFICETYIQLLTGYNNHFDNFKFDLSRATGIVVNSGKTLIYLTGATPTEIGNLTADALQGEDGLGEFHLSPTDAAKLAVDDWINLLSDQSLSSQAANKALNKQTVQVHTVDTVTGVIQIRGFLFNDFLLDDTARVQKIDTSTRIEVDGEGLVIGSGGSPAGVNPPTVFQRAYTGVLTFENKVNKWTSINCERGCWSETNCFRTYINEVCFWGCSNWRIAAYGVSWSGCQDCGTGKIRTRSGARHAVTSNAGSSTIGSWCSNGLSYGDIEHIGGYAGAMDTHAGVGPVKAGHVKELASPDFSSGSSQAVFSQGAGYQVQSLEITGGGSTGAGFQSIGWNVKNFKPSSYIGSIRGNETVSSAVACDNLTNHNDTIDSATAAIASGTYNDGTGSIAITQATTVDANIIAGVRVNLSALTGTGGFAALNGNNYLVTSVVGLVVTVAGTPGAGASTITGGVIDWVSTSYDNATGVVVMKMTVAPAHYKVGATVQLSGLTGTGGFASLNATWPVTAIVGSLVTLQATAAFGASTVTGGDLYRITTLRAIAATGNSYTSGTGVLVLAMNRTSTWLRVGMSLAMDTLTGTGAVASLNGTWPITAVSDTLAGGFIVTLLATSGFGAATITGGKVHSPVEAQPCSLSVGNIQGWFTRGITPTPTEGDVYISVSGGDMTVLGDESVNAAATAKGRAEVRVNNLKIDHRVAGSNCIAANGSAWLGSGMGATVALKGCTITSLARDTIVGSNTARVTFDKETYDNVAVASGHTAVYPAGPLFFAPIYEEGTFTPSFTCQTNAGDIVLSAVSNVNGNYTRDGNKVFVKGSWTGTPTFTIAAGDIRISGLPYAAGGSANAQAGIVVSNVSSGWTWANKQLVLRAVAGQTYMTIGALQSATGSANLQMTAVVSAASITISFSGTYTV